MILKLNYKQQNVCIYSKKDLYLLLNLKNY